ncbi:SWIM zinc finger family protein [Paenibacillus lautus]|uniref:SWIM zinc finger family protein n=1 Tax=Paenibacillus lautus TaxID=1401 RepID=UPI003D270DC2
MMNPNQTLDDIQWQTLIQQTAGYFSDLTIKRGFQYYKQGRVHTSELTEASGIIEAAVDGTETYRIQLHLHSLSDSTCSCPVNEGCKHMVAVLLDYAQLQGRSIHALVNAHSTTYAPTSTYARKESDFSPAQERPSAGASKWRVKADHLPELPISAWHELFEVCTASLGANTQNSFYAKNALASLHHIKPPMPPGMGSLYELHAHLFILEKLVKQPASAWNSSGSYIGYHTQVAADHILARIERIFHEGLESSEHGEAFKQRLTETISHVRRSMLSEPRNRKFYAQVYMQLWMYWIYPFAKKDNSLIQAELEQLQAAEAEFGSTLSRASWYMAQGLMSFYLGEDESSWDLIREADKVSSLPPASVLGFFDMLHTGQQWNRLARWLPEIGPLLGSHRNEHLSSYQYYWDAVIEHLPGEAERMWSSLADMLPYSKDIYQNALITHGRWREWIDYQLSTGREPLELRVSELAPIEKNAPELLLPFYHQAVERYILHKNRAGYKAAVKLLKRLAKLYKKLKQQERWDLFIISLSVRNSRLRAFQEELRRGKLIS